MNYQKCNFTLSLIFIALVVGLVALAAQAPSAAYAGAGLPPRDTPVPPPADDDDDKEGPPVGASIELVAPAGASGAWAVVQWQDSAGGWHNVEGWQGSLPGSSRWWVHPKDFGTGPFRWVVFEPGGASVGVSPSFHLPGQPNETLRVEVAPNP